MTATDVVTTPQGVSLVAGTPSREGASAFQATNPRTGEPLEPAFVDATSEEVTAAVGAAADAFEEVGDASSGQLATLLDAAATELSAAEDAIIALLGLETGLSEARLAREFARTTGQLRFFGELVRDGTYREAMIDHPDPDHPALPRPDMRRVLVPIGPVAVFGASNFPLAYSVPGGDTASALAAGCPVIVKAHPAHPGASELCGRALVRAASSAGFPDGWISVLQGAGVDVGRAMVLAPETKGVGFTGSVAGGRALFDLAAARPEPISVFAEMGSANPIVVMPGALSARTQELAQGFVSAITTDAGQYCTKPGLMFVPEGEDAQKLVQHVSEMVSTVDPTVLVSERIHTQLTAQLDRTVATTGVEVVARGPERDGDGLSCQPVVLATDIATFLESPELWSEHFGPVSVIVRYRQQEDLRAALLQLEGSLTATIHVEVEELSQVEQAHRILAAKAGRLVWNGFPTGLAVTHATHHGGPYPAATNVGHTSVGATAVRRFQRPVSYQSAPQEVLPPSLRDDNPLGIPRRIDGAWTSAAMEGSDV